MIVGPRSRKRLAALERLKDESIAAALRLRTRQSEPQQESYRTSK
jgi:hypothetical protein